MYLIEIDTEKLDFQRISHEEYIKLLLERVSVNLTSVVVIRFKMFMTCSAIYFTISSSITIVTFPL